LALVRSLLVLPQQSDLDRGALLAIRLQSSPQHHDDGFVLIPLFWGDKDFAS
jgi:hypothetical protein